MNIRDYKKAEPLLRRFEEPCKEIRVLKYNARMLVERDQPFSFKLPKLKKETKKLEKDPVGCKVEYSFSSMFTSILHGDRRTKSKDEGDEKIKITLSEPDAIRFHAFLIAERVAERKRVAEQLKELGLHYKSEAA